MIQIRRINRGEWEVYRNLRLQALKDSPAAFGSTYGEAIRRSPKSWQEQADSAAVGSERCTVVAFSEDVPIGMACVYKCGGSEEESDLLQVWVAPEFRGSGAAVSVIDELVAWCEQNGVMRIYAGVIESNRRVLSFYRRLGYEQTDLREYSEDVYATLVKVL